MESVTVERIIQGRTTFKPHTTRQRGNTQMDNTVEQTLVRNKVFNRYKDQGYLTEKMKEELIVVGIDPYKQVVEFSNKIAQEGATN